MTECLILCCSFIAPGQGGVYSPFAKLSNDTNYDSGKHDEVTYFLSIDKSLTRL